ncbi:transcriptional activator RfaH [Jiella sp. MQZ9-1]|uniref:NusG-like N-terminal domain-containing protein n=1 Tax=Jiella flava TaxID=2816857 RepID=A0A939JTT1_9HYPH|nr:transcription termination/antitermination NusG family protein [Jiella flava]MBO0662450.1 hypothetical protein [Jiella flava]MCD2471675.1 transcriptional activator RfaH [Jiella flava]
MSNDRLGHARDDQANGDRLMLTDPDIDTARIRPSSYAVHCRAGRESRAVANLERQAFDVFLPLLRSRQIRNGRASDVLRPLFPSYIFVSFDPAATAWRRINGTFGVKRLVTLGDAPQPVDPAFMTMLRHACDDQGVFSFRNASGFRQGERVMLASGPLAEMVGTIEAMSGTNRALLLLSILGRSTRVSVTLDDLRKIA